MSFSACEAVTVRRAVIVSGRNALRNYFEGYQERRAFLSGAPDGQTAEPLVGREEVVGAGGIEPPTPRV
jgi:hypothetical protein